MAYVQPNSIIQFFKGINLDNRYLHTIYFANESAQNTWFTSKVTSALTFSNMMYRRYTSQSVKVEADATTFLGVTYMRFKNTRTANKWFYAFVLSADYVNENTTLVTYEIDVMQTWFIQNGSVRPCMVIREHVNDDTIFSNLEAEPVGSDAYEYEYITDANTLSGGAPTTGEDIFTDYSVVVSTTGNLQDDNPTEPMYNQGLFNGVKHDWVRCNSDNDTGAVAILLDNYLGSWDAGEQQQEVLSIITFPSYFVDRSYSTDLAPATKLVNGFNLFNSHYDGEVLTGYVPKNLKLFSYPYNYLYCTTHNGDAGQYRWEYFDNGNATNHMTNKHFDIAGSFLGGGQIKCYPKNYDGIDANYECGVSMTDFPRNAFNYDAYQAWIANGGKTRLENDSKLVKARGVTNIIASTSNFISTGMTSANNIYNAFEQRTSIGHSTMRSPMDKASVVGREVNNAVQAGVQLANTIYDYKEAKNKIDYQWKDASYRPNEVVGTSEPSIMVGGRMLNFYFYDCHIVLSELKRIDDFFSCYGYSINKVKSPNLTGRTYWNFVQTQNAVIAGDMPSSSKEAIGRIFDGGITFWHNGDQVGNYRQSVSNDSINNPIV